MHNPVCDPNGNLLILDRTIENNRLTLTSIYGPISDNLVFYQTIIKLMKLTMKRLFGVAISTW